MAADEGRLPEETLAMLFSDVESSTRHLGMLGRSYDESLARHHEIVRSAFVPRGGEEVHNAGDGFFVVFTAVTDAVEAAIEAQRQLHEATWPDGVEFRVRMGVHLGPTRWRPILGFSGLEVHRASRISDAAHGGQCLVSAQVRDALIAEGFDRRLLFDRGRHRLKGFENEPERLFELIIDGRFDNRPLRARSIETTHLPTFATPMLGREEEIEQLRQLLEVERVRSVTVAGAGGVGKTRLVLEFIRTRIHKRRIRFVELAELERPELFVPTVAEQLALSVSTTSAADAVSDYLFEEPTLLVLDNFEQLRPAAPSVLRWLDDVPHLQVLMTSRMPLRVRQEHVISLQPLPTTSTDGPSAAAELFRAAATDSGLRQFGDGHESAVAEICRSVDGLPLAIEMAASRARSFGGVASLAAAMREPLTVLTAPGHDASERHASMANTIDFSVQLLGAPARDLLHQLAVLPAGATLASATTWSDGDGSEAIQAAGELVDSGLVSVTEQSDRQPRLMTARLIREFGIDRLTHSGHLSTVRLRAAQHLQQTAQIASVELLGKRQFAAMANLDADLENFRALFSWPLEEPAVNDPAVATAADLVTYWWLSRPQEGLDWLRSLTDDPERDSRHRARALVRSALLASWLGEADTVIERAQLGVALCRAKGRATATLSHGLQLLALAWAASGRRSMRRRALAAVEEGLSIDAGLPDQLRAVHFTNHADVFLAFNQLDRAIPLFQESLDLFNVEGDSWLIAAPKSRLGEVALRQGRITEAKRLLYESVQLWIGSDSLAGPARALAGLARVARADGDRTEAAALQAEAWRFVRSTRSHGEAPWVLAGMGVDHLERGRTEDGMRTLAAAVTLGRAFGQPVQACIENELGDPLSGRSLRREVQHLVAGMRGMPTDQLLALGDS